MDVGLFSYSINLFYARVAQLDRALASEAKGRGFDSRLAHFVVEFCYGFGTRNVAPETGRPMRG